MMIYLIIDHVTAVITVNVLIQPRWLMTRHKVSIIRYSTLWQCISLIRNTVNQIAPGKITNFNDPIITWRFIIRWLVCQYCFSALAPQLIFSSF